MPQHPVCCPFCGGAAITTYMVMWDARSLEPQDPDNTGVLDEHQCHDCAKSFWT